MSETFPTQIHKLTVLIVDHDELGVDEVKEVLENQHYPNHCLSPCVLHTETQAVEWTDDHPLNSYARREAAFAALFPTPEAAVISKLRQELASMEHAYGQAHAASADFANKVLQQAQDLADLREALQGVLASAVPNQRDHPAMFAAWKTAREVLEKTR